MSKVPFSELATAAYCPRKLYYQRRDDIEIPDLVVERRQFVFEYDELPDTDLTDRPIAIPRQNSARISNVRPTSMRGLNSSRPSNVTD